MLKTYKAKRSNSNRTNTLFVPRVKRCVALLALLVSSVASSIVHAQLVSAVLPNSRSAEIGDTVTVFATVINGGTDMALGCGIEGPAGLGIEFSYQTTNPSTNELTGAPNTPVNLAPAGSQSFVLSLTPSAPIDALDAAFVFSCTSGASAEAISGVNTLQLSAANDPVPDIIALSATAGNTGLLALNSSAGAFALATINLGAEDSITVAADTGSVSLPVVTSVCATDPDTGACLEDPASSVTVNVPTGATPTFSVFSTATGSIRNNPALNRVFVRFTDSSSVVRGGTSVAIENELDLVPSLSENTLSVLSRVFTLLFGSSQLSSGNVSPSSQSPAVTEPIDQVIACDTGQAVVSGSIDADSEGSSSTLVMTFEDCDGITGSLTNVTTALFDGTTLDLVSTQNGSYSSDECEEVVVSDLEISTSFSFLDPIDDIIDTANFEVSGNISGQCEGESFSCNLQDVDLANEAEFTSSCSI